MELPPPHLQEAKGREPPSMSCGHKINMVVRHAQARLESSRNVALIFFKAKMVAILKMMDLQKKYSQKYIQQERMLDFQTLSCHFQIHHGPNIPMQQLHKHKFDEDMKVVLEFDLKNSHLRFSLIFLREYFEGMSPKQRVDFTEILAVHIGHPIFTSSLISS